MSYPQTNTKTIKPFTYVSAKTVHEAVSALEQHGASARLAAGGTDLLSQMKHRSVVPEYVVGLTRIKELDGIQVEGGVLRIGALATWATIRESSVVKEHCYALYEAACVFATAQIRNRATIGGNVARSAPSADSACPLLSHDASVTLVGASGSRSVALEKFFTGSGCCILSNEVLTEILVPIGGKPYGSAFAKLTRNSSDLAKVNAAVKIGCANGRISNVRIAVGAVAPTPLRIPAAEKAIEGLECTGVSDSALESVADAVAQSIAPISDARSTAQYRSDASRVLVKRLVVKALERARQ